MHFVSSDVARGANAEISKFEIDDHLVSMSETVSVSIDSSSNIQRYRQTDKTATLNLNHSLPMQDHSHSNILQFYTTAP